MVFPKKRQARIWCICIIYRHLIRSEDFRPTLANNVNQDELSKIFYDDAIFRYKGDVEYFVDIYNTVSSNFTDIVDKLSTIIADDRIITDTIKAGLLCAIAEIEYMKISTEVIIPEYLILMREYGEENPAQMFKKLVEKVV